MTVVRKSLRVPEDLAQAVQEAADASGCDFSTMANTLLAEAVKMRRCPGIVFADSPAGRRARLAGTGLDIWEIIASYKSLGRNFARLRRAYHWLTESQLRAVLGYYAAYPEEIEEQIARNEAWTKERLAQQYPALAKHASRNPDDLPSYTIDFL